MRVKAVLFDLFDTLLLIRGGEAFYMSSLKRLHEFLVHNGVNVDFEDFSRVYFTVRDELYAEASKNFEEPHFNVRVSHTLQRLGYNFDVLHPTVFGLPWLLLKSLCFLFIWMKMRLMYCRN